MKLLEVYKYFPNEKSYRITFKEMRKEIGIMCSKCGNTTHYWKRKREEWEYKKNSHRMRLRLGTVIRSRKPLFQYDYSNAHDNKHKKLFQQRNVNINWGKRYEPVWAILNKFLLVMGAINENYTLGKEIELNDGVFKTVSIT